VCERGEERRERERERLRWEEEGEGKKRFCMNHRMHSCGERRGEKKWKSVGGTFSKSR
jgi:hypothetical protein